MDEFGQKVVPNGIQESFQKSMHDTQAEKREGTGAKEKLLEKTIYEVQRVYCSAGRS